MFTRDKFISEITQQLSWIKAKIGLSASIHLLDDNIHAESFFCGLLNIVFGYHLENLNFESANYAAIDLGDDVNKIAVQITSDNTSSKIQKTLRTFVESGYSSQYNRLIIFLIGDKRNYSATFDTQGKLNFSKENDIWDIQFLIQEIGRKSTQEIQKISDYLNSQLTPASGYQGVCVTGVIGDMQKATQAMCKAKLKSLGVLESAANKIVESELQSQKYDYIIAAAQNNNVYLTGGFGTGKSHALLILAQRKQAKYLETLDGPVPLFTQARNIVAAGTIQLWLNSLNLGLLNYILFIDGLDEIEYIKAEQIIEELNFLEELTSDNRIIVGSRPLSIIPRDKAIDIHPLSNDEREFLYSTITEEAEAEHAFLHLKPELEQLLGKPFFCILYAQFKAEPRSWAKTDMDLVSAFIERVLPGFHESKGDFYKDFMRIAVKSIDKSLDEIHISEVFLENGLENLLKTGFLLYRDRHISFTLPIIAQWMASEAIRWKIVSIEEILSDRDRAMRWLYPMSILFSQMTFEESTCFFTQITKTLPEIASHVIREGIRFEVSKVLPSSTECGRRLQYCMQVWVDTLGPLSRFIAPVKNGKLLPLGIDTTGAAISFSWGDFKTNDSVVPLSTSEALRTGSKICSSGVFAQSTWPWIVTFDFLSDNLKTVLKNHCVIVKGSQLEKEFIWKTALQMTGRGRLYEGNIEFSSLEKYRKHIGRNWTLNGHAIQTDLFFSILDRWILEGRLSIEPPYPVSDKEPSESTGWVWSVYSIERYLEKVQFVYETGLSEYSQIVQTVFSPLSQGMHNYQFMPCSLIGGLKFDPQSSSPPSLTWYIQALPNEEKSYTDIQLREIPFHDSARSASVRKINESLRPELRGRSSYQITQQSVYFTSPTPVTDLVYDWLQSDLKNSGWLSRF